MADKINLTERQREIFDYIEAHFAATGVMPTHTDIAKQFDMSNPGVAKHLMSLERRGWIRRARGMKSGLSIVE